MALVRRLILSFIFLSLALEMARGAPSEPRRNLESLVSEMTLLIRNEKSNAADLRRQEREFQIFKVFERIPFQDNLSQLKSEILQSAASQGLEIDSFKILGKQEKPLRFPAEADTNDPIFRISREDVARRIDFMFTIRAARARAEVSNWTRTWKTDLVRIIELDRMKETSRSVSVFAHAYAFKNIKLPKPRLRRPAQELLTDSLKDPFLGELARKVKSLGLDALPLYENRSRFLLNAARMSFFLSKAQ